MKNTLSKTKPSAVRLQRARDRRLIVCMSVYIACSALSIVDLYFHYSFCRWHNRWHRAFHEEGGSEGEPSTFALVTSKISGWFVFIFMQLTAFVPVIFSALLYL